MRAKLIKTSRGKYLLLEPSKDIKEGWKPSLLGSLSLKNCQAIERGSHLEKLKVSIDEFDKSLQQNEWEVEIEMDNTCCFGTCTEADYMICIDGCVNKEPEPKLDENGCLILKRI